MTDAPWLGTALLWGGLGGGLVFVIAGLVVVARTGLRLTDRLENVGDLALLAQLDTVQEKFARVSSRIDEFPALIARAQRALVALRDSRLQVQAIGQTLNLAAQIARALLLGPEKKGGS